MTPLAWQEEGGDVAELVEQVKSLYGDEFYKLVLPGVDVNDSRCPI
jgi:hypothetical protein